MYRQMAFQSLLDDALISPNQQSFGTPGQTKVSGDHQRETTHGICCLAAEYWFMGHLGRASCTVHSISAPTSQE